MLFSPLAAGQKIDEKQIVSSASEETKRKTSTDSSATTTNSLDLNREVGKRRNTSTSSLWCFCLRSPSRRRGKSAPTRKRRKGSLQIVEHSGTSSAPTVFCDEKAESSSSEEGVKKDQNQKPEYSGSLYRSHPLEPNKWQLLGEGALIKPLNLESLPYYTSNNKDFEEARKLAKKLFEMEAEKPYEKKESPSYEAHFMWDEYESFNSDFDGGRLGRTQDALNRYKQRIDANVEHQKEHSGLISTMQNKLAEYRKHIFELERLLGVQKREPGESFVDSGIIGVGADISDWSRIAGIGDANANYETVISRIEDERRRYDDLRNQFELEHQHSEQLQTDLLQLRRELEDKERDFRNREKNLAQYLREEQGKVLDLWTELQRVQRQFRDLRNETENELEKQQRDFNRISRSIRGVAETDGIREGGALVDKTLIEIINRSRDRSTGPTVDLIDFINRLKLGGEVRGEDPELHKDLIKKYEEAIERNIQLESGSDENARRASELEFELRRVKDRLNECQNAIRKMYDMSTASGRKEKMEQKRSRSASPIEVTSVIQPEEAVRTLKNVLREKENIILDLEYKLRNCENKSHELLAKLDSIGEINRGLENEANNLKDELNEREKLIENNEYQRKRMEDKMKSLENEKRAMDVAQKNLENDLMRLKQQFEKTTIESSRKARDEAEDYAVSLENDYKNRIEELNRRISGIQDERQKSINELTTLKTRLRELENENIRIQRSLEEKDSQLKLGEDYKIRAIGEIEALTEQLNEAKGEVEKLHEVNMNCSRENAALEDNNREIKQRGEELNQRIEELSNSLNAAKNALVNEKNEKESVLKQMTTLKEEIGKLKTELGELEQQHSILRQQNDELDTQIKTAQAKQIASDNEITTNKKEIASLTEINQKLQREKQDYLNEKHYGEVEIERLKEQLRKLEQELEKIQREMTSLQSSEAESKNEAIQQTNKAQLLQNELDEANAELKHLKDRIEEMEKDFKNKLKKVQWKQKGKSTTTTTTTGGEEEGGAPEQGDFEDVDGGREKGISEQDVDEYDPEMIERRINDINEKWKLEVERLERDKERLEAKVWELEDQLGQAERGGEMQKNEIEEARRKLEAEIDRLKEEIKRLKERHQSELEDERDESKKNLDIIRRKEQEVEEKLQQIEKQLANALNRQSELERAKREINERLDATLSQNQKLRNELEDAKSEADKENQRWKSDAFSAHSEAKSLETTISGLKSQLNAANERNDTLTKTTNDYASKIRESSIQMRKFEDELAELRSSISNKELELESAVNKLRQLEDQHLQIQIENTRLHSELELKGRENEASVKQLGQIDSEFKRVKEQLRKIEEESNEQKQLVAQLRIDRDRLQNGYREKVRSIDSLQDALKKLEDRLDDIGKECQYVSEKLIIAESDKANLQSKLSNALKELEFGREQMLNKTSEYQSAIDELSLAHRNSEDGRLVALQELETKKYELSDMEAKLSGIEQRLQRLHNDYIQVDSERDFLADLLRRFHISVGQTIGTSKDGVPTSGGQGVIKSTDKFDTNEIDAALRDLTKQIERLRIEHDQYRDELNRLRKKPADVDVKKRETHYKFIEESLDNVEDEKRSLETRLATAKRLLKSQEETMKEREEERRQLKGRVITADLETRGKDSQIRHLNEQLKNMRTDLDNAHTELRSISDKNEVNEASRYQLESKLRDSDSELQQLNVKMNGFQVNNQNLNEKLKELSGQLRTSELKNSDLNNRIEKLRQDLERTANTEGELRKNLELLTKENMELVKVREKMTQIQNELTNNVSRKSEIEIELSSANAELRNSKMRINELNSRLTELQRQLQDLQTEKGRQNDKVHDLERQVAIQRLSESELRQRNETLKGEKQQLSKNLDELQARIRQLEGEKANLNQLQKQCGQEKASLKKRIDALENEKRRTDAAIHETALQREAIEKSLNAMERENRELYKNCAQLQQQINQLEVENGSRLMEITKRQREDHEKQLLRIRNEKAQIEKLIENRERICRQKVQQLEGQCRLLKDQLNAERQRSRDFRERQIASGYASGRLRDTIGTGFNSSHGSYWPMLSDNIDNTGFRPIGSRTFISNPLTPPRGMSTPTAHRQQERGVGLDESRELEHQETSTMSQPIDKEEELASLHYYKGL